MQMHLRATIGYLTAVGVFSILLAWFVFGKGWYAPATLIVKGIAPDKSAELEISWDSGAGWNDYEQRIFPIRTFRAGNGDGEIFILIRPLGEKNPASLSTEVVCSRIRVDGKEIDLKGIGQTGRYRNDGIHLSTPVETIRFSASATKHIYIELLTNNHSGKVGISVSGHTVTRDLYMANEAAKSTHFDFWLAQPDRHFTVKTGIPRYRIQTVKVCNRIPELPIYLTSVAVSTGNKSLPLDAPTKPRLLSTFQFSGVNAERKQYFLPSRFSVQVIFAALTTWLIVAACRWIGRRGGILKALFSRDRRPFWIFFIGAAGIYSLWLVAFWPGVMSVDSLKVWRAAQLPDVFINDHPFFFVLFYTYLQQFWNHVAVVPIFHILSVSYLIAYISYSLYRDSVPLWAIVPVYVVLVFSVPIGLYNVVLWKDIPFAILVVFWAFLLAILYRKHRSGRIFFSHQQTLALFLLYLAVSLTRHNGLLYLGLIPIFLVMLRIVPVKVAAVTFMAVALMVGAGLIVFRSKIPVSNTGFLLEKSAQYIKRARGESFGQELKRTFLEYWGIFNINQTRSKWDLWHYYLGDRQAYWFLRHSGWWDAYPYVVPNRVPFPGLRKMGMKIYWKSYEAPWVYLTWNPVLLLALFPLPLFLFRWLPSSAVYSGFILAQVMVLLGFLGVLNWRYYYFFYFGLFFIPLLILQDIKELRTKRLGAGA